MKRLLIAVAALAVMFCVFVVQARAAEDVVFEYRNLGNGHTGLYIHALSDSVIGVFWGVGDGSTTLRRISTPHTPNNWWRALDEHTPPQYANSCVYAARICGSCQRDYTMEFRQVNVTGNFWKYEGLVAEWPVLINSTSGYPNAQAVVETRLPEYAPYGERSGNCVVQFTSYTPQCSCAHDCDDEIVDPKATRAAVVSPWGTVKAMYRD